MKRFSAWLARLVPLRLSKFAWAMTGYNLLVILWGAFVRISHSGAGCADHWPTCNGELIPTAPSTETLIEFIHRATSGVTLILAVYLVIKAFAEFEKRHRVRKWAVATLVFVLSEAALGAGLVIFGLVDKDQSVMRAVVTALHLANTLGLVGCGALTAYYASPSLASIRVTPAAYPKKTLWRLAYFAMIVTSMTGAITALGDTLFPVADVEAGLVDDSHFLVQLRIIHPFAALMTAFFLATVAGKFLSKDTPKSSRIWAQWTLALVVIQVIAGVINVWLGAPAWMQLLHLALADILWITLLVLAASTRERRETGGTPR